MMGKAAYLYRHVASYRGEPLRSVRSARDGKAVTVIGCAHADHMTGYEKHDLLVLAFWVLVVIPIWAEITFFPTYWVSGITKVHIPDDVVRAGFGLAAIGAVVGGLFGVGFTQLAAGQADHQLWINSAGDAALFLLPAVAIIYCSGLLLLRGGSITPDHQRESDRLGPTAWSQQIRWLRAEPYLTVGEQRDLLHYANELTAAAEIDQVYRAIIRGGLCGFWTFMRFYFGDKVFRAHNGMRLRIACCCGAAVMASAGIVWVLAGTWFSSQVIVPCTLAEILVWLVMRWFYERIRLTHMAKARRTAAHEINNLAKKKLRLPTEVPAMTNGKRDIRKILLSVKGGVLLGKINLRRRRAAAATGSAEASPCCIADQ